MFHLIALDYIDLAKCIIVKFFAWQLVITFSYSENSSKISRVKLYINHNKCIKNVIEPSS